MKIVLISDDGSKHKLMSLKYGLQYVLPLLFLALFFLPLVYLNYYSKSIDTSARQTLSELKSLPSSSIEQINYRFLNKKIIELNDAVLYLAKKKSLNLEEVDVESQSLIKNQNYKGDQITTNKGFENIETLERDIKEQESNLRRVKTHLEFKQLEDQALELYADKSNGVQLISDFIMPVKNGHTTSRYGFRKDPINGAHRNHRGIDLAAPRGTTVTSIADGYVTFIGRRGAYGKVIEITHSDSLKSRYAHLNSYNVSMGKVVNKGSKIGEVGSTGRVTGPHLHLEVWKKGNTVDPLYYLRGIKYVDN